MALKLCLATLSVVITATSVVAADTKDPRYIAISKSELQKRIQTTPIDDASKHSLLTARADSSRLQKLAYDEYTKLWEKSPNSANVNLRRGIAALNYWRFVAFTPRKREDVKPQEGLSLFATTRSCLAKSIALNPRSVPANVAYGYFIWQYDNQMDEGLALLKKAEKLAPNDAKVHANLGAIYGKSSGNAYNLDKAEKELRLSIQLDRTWAYPYSLLVPVFIKKKNYKDAQWALNAYSKLSNSTDLKVYQQSIDRGLGKTKVSLLNDYSSRSKVALNVG